MTVCTAWIEIDEDLGECGCPMDAGESILQASIDTATDILYRFSGRQWPGLCTETVRPCRAAAACGCSTFHLCHCVGGDTLELGKRRVVSVDAVKIDGAAFTDFKFYKPNWVVRTDDWAWPCCQDLSLDDTEDGTWSIQYSYGATPPTAAKNATRVLTSELVKACTADKSCRIPTGAVSLTRRGVSYDLSQVEGRTGISEVDLWLSAVNPKKRARRARVVSPDDVRFVPTGS